MIERRPKNTSTGQRKEKAVVSWLEKKGWKIVYEGGIGASRYNCREWKHEVVYSGQVHTDSLDEFI